MISPAELNSLFTADNGA